jgi:iron complex transport system permease protein
LNNATTYYRYLLLITLLIPIFIVWNLFSGQINVSFNDLSNAIFQFDSNVTTQVIIREFRIPRMTMAILSGSTLALCGMFMQTLFNNPLAGPYVLGINTGSSLFVAFTILSGIPFFTSDLGMTSSAMIGAFIFGVIILSCSLLVRSQISLLLIGLMISSLAGALISTLELASESEQLKQFSIWSFGSLQQVNFQQLPFIMGITTIAVLFSFFLVKPLNALTLGESSAKNLGINIRNIRIIIIGITAVLVGTITAFCGPIAFVGLAIPNLCRLLFKTQKHQILIIGNLIIGSIFMLSCDSIIQHIEPYFSIPLNAFTSILGAPFVIFMILKRLV